VTTKLEVIIAAMRSVQIEPTPDEVADLLWLAQQIGPPSEGVQKPSPAPTTASQSSDSGKPAQIQNNASIVSPPKAKVYLPAPGNADLVDVSRSGLAFRSPAAAALPDALPLGRAIRPLMRRIPSHREFLLDEDATVQRISSERIWVPKLRPAPARWLDLALVVEESTSMAVWYRTIAELQRLLERHGAFRDVRVWGLSTDDKRGVWVHTGFGPAARNGRPRSPQELIDPTGRRLILVVSDCMSLPWYDGTVNRLLAEWGRRGSFTIAQVLPERLWLRSALGEMSPIRVHALEPGASNSRLQVAGDTVSLSIPQSGGLAIPIVTFEEGPLKNWARMVAGIGGAWIPGRLLNLSTPEAVGEPTPLTSLYNEHDRSLTPRQRVRNFQATASPLARRLAGLLAAAPLRLPVMRLIQQTMLPESRQVHLAEVMLGGLLRQVTPNADLLDPDEVDYAFVDEEVQDLLLEKVSADAAIQVMKHVSYFIELELGQPSDFAALLDNPGGTTGELQIKAGSLPFAEVTARVLRRFGGDYIRLADWLDGRQPETSILGFSATVEDVHSTTSLHTAPEGNGINSTEASDETSLLSQENIRTMTRGIQRHFPLVNILVMTYDNTQQSLRFHPESLTGSYHIDEPAHINARWIPIGNRSIAGRAALQALNRGHSFLEYVPDVTQDPSYLQFIHTTRSELCIAAVDSGGHLTHVVAIDSDSPYAFNDNDIKVIQKIVSTIDKIRVLIITSEPEEQQSYAEFLRLWDYEPVIAEGTGNSLINDAINQHRMKYCQIALVDIRLHDRYDTTDYSGLELIPHLENVKVIILTTQSNLIDKIGSLNTSNIFDTISKRAELNELRNSLVECERSILLGITQTVEPLLVALNDADVEVRRAAIEALGQLGDVRAVEPLLVALNDADVEVRRAAIEALGQLGDVRAVEPLLVTLQDVNPVVRQASVLNLGRLVLQREVDDLPH